MLVLIPAFFYKNKNYLFTPIIPPIIPATIPSNIITIVYILTVNPVFKILDNIYNIIIYIIPSILPLISPFLLNFPIEIALPTKMLTIVIPITAIGIVLSDKFVYVNIIENINKLTKVKAIDINNPLIII